MGWQQLLYIAAGLLVVWLIYKMIQGRPDAFSKKNLSKSFYAMGFLGLALVAFVFLLIFLLKA